MGIIKGYLVNVVLCSLIGALVSVILCYAKNKQKNSNKAFVGEVLFGTYLAILFSLTVLPRVEIGILSNTGKLYVTFLHNSSVNSTINLIPFRSIYNYIMYLFIYGTDSGRTARINILGNIILYIPMGILLNIKYKEGGKSWRTVILSVSISLTIEIIQLLVGRSPDIDDVILNTVGTLIGCGFYRMIKNIKLKDR